jgi:hypothetical protein
VHALTGDTGEAKLAHAGWKLPNPDRERPTSILRQPRHALLRLALREAAVLQFLSDYQTSLYEIRPDDVKAARIWAPLSRE